MIERCHLEPQAWIARKFDQSPCDRHCRSVRFTSLGNEAVKWPKTTEMELWLVAELEISAAIRLAF